MKIAAIEHGQKMQPFHCCFTAITGPGKGCTEGDVRLVGGGNEFMGRVEVCLGGEWGTVCGNTISTFPITWGSNGALVVCRQLFGSSSGEFELVTKPLNSMCMLTLSLHKINRKCCL